MRTKQFPLKTIDSNGAVMLFICFFIIGLYIHFGPFLWLCNLFNSIGYFLYPSIQNKYKLEIRIWKEERKGKKGTTTINHTSR
mmetsp:Transcript_5681/g.5516  ORF Transcript_5681/g.5516 Transcript_5681/m.5516 type:complete len:83 (-) Transcript_5681:28-276(-)